MSARAKLWLRRLVAAVMIALALAGGAVEVRHDHKLSLINAGFLSGLFVFGWLLGWPHIAKQNAETMIAWGAKAWQSIKGGNGGAP